MEEETRWGEGSKEIRIEDTRSPGIDSNESIPSGYIGWYDNPIALLLLGS
jgi:hypothetical protein